MGDDGPKQVTLRSYAVSMFGAKQKCFDAASFERWDWLQYSVKLNVAFCLPCRNYECEVRGIRCESTFAHHGYCKPENKKVFSKHRASKEHSWHAIGAMVARKN